MNYASAMIIMVLLLVSGCSNDEAMSQLQQENKEIKQQNVKLLQEQEDVKQQQEITTLAQDNAELTSQIQTLKAEMDARTKTLNHYQESFKRLQTSTKVIEERLSIFSPDTVQKGDKIAGLMVSEVMVKKGSAEPAYQIDFTGETVINAYVFLNMVGGTKYSMLVEENIESIPHSLLEFERDYVFFNIKNDAALERALGGKVKNLSESDRVEVKGVFNHFSYVYIPQSEVANTVEFVSLASNN